MVRFWKKKPSTRRPPRVYPARTRSTRRQITTLEEPNSNRHLRYIIKEHMTMVPFIQIRLSLLSPLLIDLFKRRWVGCPLSSSDGDYFKWNTIFHWLSLNRWIVQYDAIHISHLRITAIMCTIFTSATSSVSRLTLIMLTSSWFSMYWIILLPFFFWSGGDTLKLLGCIFEPNRLNMLFWPKWLDILSWGVFSLVVLLG
jgi:hypothetical protein